MIALTDHQRGILAFHTHVLGDAASCRSIEILRCGVSGPFGQALYERMEYAVACFHVVLADATDLFVYASLGTLRGSSAVHAHQFFAVVDERTADVAHVVALACAFQESGTILDADHTLRLPDTDALRGRGYSNVLVAGADLHAPYAGKGDILLAGRSTRLLALVPLEPSELRVKVDDGVPALFQRFRASGRDLLHLRSVQPSEVRR